MRLEKIVLSFNFRAWQIPNNCVLYTIPMGNHSDCDSQNQILFLCSILTDIQPIKSNSHHMHSIPLQTTERKYVYLVFKRCHDQDLFKLLQYK